jgi:hypothetical protein
MMEKADVKRIADVEANKAVKGHEKSMHGVKKMAKGGKTNAQMKTLGRGLAKVANQKQSSFTYKRGG